MRSSRTNWKLADHPKLPKGKTIAMIVLDGWGEANPDRYYCIHIADTPSMDSFKKVFYKHKIVLFGGFYDTLREVRYYNDLHVFDLDQFKVKKSSEQRPNSLDYENVNGAETEESATNGKDGSLECQEQEVDTESSIKAQSNFFSFQKQL